MRRVAITGMGTVNALGTGVDTFARELRAGTCGIGELSLFSLDGYRTRIAAEVRDLTAPEWLDPRTARRASRTTLLALIAAREALDQAGLDSAERATAAIVMGSTTGGMPLGEENYRRLTHGEHPLQSAWLETPVSAPGDAVAAALAVHGPRLTVSTACSSGANALGIAADWIRDSRVRTALCGGVDALCRMTFSGFNSLQALDKVACRPFDRERGGLSLGEGAAMLVLEDWDHALARGATILAEMVSYGMSSDAHHLTQPRADGAGAILAMRRAFAEGEISPDEIDYVNAHGTGTPLNDSTETRALHEVFGARAPRVPISSTKSMIGHCLGAAGAIEAATCVVALREGFLPPTVNLHNADPECDLDYVPNVSRTVQSRTVLSNSYGFGGNNTSLILRAAT